MERIISAERVEDILNVFGSFDQNLHIIEKEWNVCVTDRDAELKISGEPEDVVSAEKAVQNLLMLAARGENVDEQRVRYVIGMIRSGQEDQIRELDSGVVCITAKGRPVKPKTLGQKAYVQAIRENTVTLGIGPAGTGKTYLAVAAAVAAFREKSVNLRPLYDALFDMLGPETYNTYLEKGNIEVAPLAYMRGRTLDDSFIILDEAQNTSREQMKMFLTRLGFNSKMVITGDVTQIDLPADKASGLKEAMKVLDGVDDIAICRFTGADVVRHALVQQIIAAYEKHEKAAAAAAEREKKTAAPQRRDNSGYNNYKRK